MWKPHKKETPLGGGYTAINCATSYDDLSCCHLRDSICDDVVMYVIEYVVSSYKYLRQRHIRYSMAQFGIAHDAQTCFVWVRACVTMWAWAHMCGYATV